MKLREAIKAFFCSHSLSVSVSKRSGSPGPARRCHCPPLPAPAVAAVGGSVVGAAAARAQVVRGGDGPGHAGMRRGGQLGSSCSCSSPSPSGNPDDDRARPDALEHPDGLLVAQAVDGLAVDGQDLVT